MPLSVIQQPNGLFAVWSSTVDAFLMLDATADDVQGMWLQRAVERAVNAAESVLKRARGEDQPPPAYDLATCVELCEANNTDDMLLPMVKAMLAEAKP